jgi:alpha-L-rhamnosidase
VLGDGWYAGHVGLAGRAVYGDVPAAACLLRIEYADGRRETVVSDALWQATDNGPIRRADLLMGETYDAGRELAGWSDPAAQDARAVAPSPWRPAVVRDGVVGAAPLVEPQRDSGVRRTEEIPARGVTEPKPGVFVFDLGQNLVGWARLKTRGPAGSRITLRFAEMLNPDGTIYTANYRGARCTDEYVLRGDRNGETWEPRFTFRGFRYVEMTGRDPAGRKPGLDAVTGVVVHSEMPRAGTMETSSPLVNRLLANIDWGSGATSSASPPTARSATSGSAGPATPRSSSGPPPTTATSPRSSPSGCSTWRTPRVRRGVPRRRAARGRGRGGGGVGRRRRDLPVDAVPGLRRPRAAGSPLPVDDPVDRVLREEQPGAAAAGRRVRRLAEHRRGHAEGRPRDRLLRHSTRLVARAAAALGKAEDAARYEDLFRRIGAAFQAAMSPRTGASGATRRPATCSRCASTCSAPSNARPPPAVWSTTSSGTKRGTCRPASSASGALPGADRTGNTDVAYRLLLNETFPSWGYSIRQGATTIWERWDGWTRDKGFQDPA